MPYLNNQCQVSRDSVDEMFIFAHPADLGEKCDLG